MILCLPLIMIQVLTTTVFLERYWHATTQALAQNIVQDVRTLLLSHPQTHALSKVMKIRVKNYVQGQGSSYSPTSSIHVSILNQALQRAGYDKAYGHLNRRFLIVVLPQGKETWTFTMSSKRLFTRTLRLYLYWSGVTTLVFGCIAWLFMREQIRPLRLLIKWLRQSRSQKPLKIRGPDEIRWVASACQGMRKRLEQRLTERIEMLQGIAHDLRTPLARMKVQLALLPETQENQNLGEDIQQMARMVDRYVDYAQDHVPSKAQPVSVLLCIQAWEKACTSSKTLHVHCPRSARLFMDRGDLERCLTNLLDNAWRHSQTCVHVTYQLSPRGIEIRIEDDGPGIPAEHYDNVRQPFVRLSTERHLNIEGSTGLGLSIVEKCLKPYRGRLVMGKSSSWGGAQVSLIFPLSVKAP